MKTNDNEREYVKNRIRPLSENKKQTLTVKLYLDNTTLKLLAALFERDIPSIVQTLERADIKKCVKCEKVLSRNDFHKKGSAVDGLMHRCKTCQHEYRKEYYHKDPETGLAKSNAWKNANRDRVNELRRIRNQIPENKIKSNEYAKHKRDTDPRFRLRSYFSGLISYSLANHAKVKSKQGKSWEEILDYNLDDLIIHLESKFQSGMTWDNYGSWHVDHIIPQSYFKCESIDDPLFHECWKLTNLQPLWAEDNFEKGNRIDWMMI